MPNTVAMSASTTSCSIVEVPRAFMATAHARRGLSLQRDVRPADSSWLRVRRIEALGRLGRADREPSLQLQEVLLADALHVHQVLDFLERTVLLAVLDDPLGHLGADAGKVFEIRSRCGVEVDDRRRL